MNIDIALDYLRRGFCVIPMDSNLTETKKPRAKWKHFEAKDGNPLPELPIEEIIRSQWRRYPDSNIAVITGRLSNLFVLDADTPEIATEIQALLDKDGVNAPKVQTARGAHFYFRHRDGLKSTTYATAHFDVRTEGGLSVLPPSKKGAFQYSWTSGEIPRPEDIPPLPDRLFAFIQSQPENQKKASHFHGGEVSRSEIAEPLTEGRRNNDLNKFAFLAAKNGTSLENTMSFLRPGAIEFGLCEAEIEPTILSGWQAGFNELEKKETFAAENASIRLAISTPSLKGISPIRWVWKGRIPIGMNVAVIGDPGVGKTFFCADAAARVSAGLPFPDYDGIGLPVRGKVIYITSEGVPEHVLTPRLVAAGADLSNIRIIQGVLNGESIGQLDIVRHLSILEETVVALGDVILVIIDPIISHLNPRTDTQSQTDVRLAMDRLSAFAEKMGVAVITVMHMNKNEKMDIIHRSAGSMQFMAAVRMAWAVVKNSKGAPNSRLLVPVKNNLTEHGPALEFSIEGKYLPYGDREEIPTAQLIYGTARRDVNVEELASQGRVAEKSATAMAIEILNEELKEGPKLASEVYEAAKKHGISERILRNAKRHEGVSHYRQGFQGKVYWKKGNGNDGK